MIVKLIITTSGYRLAIGNIELVNGIEKFAGRVFFNSRTFPYSKAAQLADKLDRRRQRLGL